MAACSLSTLSLNLPKPVLQVQQIHPLNSPVLWSWSMHSFVSAPHSWQLSGGGGAFLWRWYLSLLRFESQALHIFFLCIFTGVVVEIANSSSDLTAPQSVHVSPGVSNFSFCSDGDSEVVILSSFDCCELKSKLKIICVFGCALVLEFVMDESKLWATERIVVGDYHPTLRYNSGRSLK